MTTKVETHTHIRRLYLTAADLSVLYARAEDIAMGQLEVIRLFYTDTIDPVARLARLTRKMYAHLIKAKLVANCFNARRETVMETYENGTIMIEQRHTDSFKIV